MTRKESILKIALSGLLSVLISMVGVNYGAVELGAIIYFIVPVIVCLSTIFLFIIIDAYTITKKASLVKIFFIINIITGIFMRLDFYYNLINW